MIFIGGVIVGIIIAAILSIFNKTYGVIYVDHKNGLCRVKIMNEDLNDRKTKKVIFKVYHSDKGFDEISRDEQSL